MASKKIDISQELNEKLYYWHKIKAEAKALAEEESRLRFELASALFPERREGTDSIDLGNGYELKCTNSVTRKVSEEIFTQHIAEMEELGISTADLVNWKPSLNLRNYRRLPANHMEVFNNCLEIKPGAVKLEIVVSE